MNTRIRDRFALCSAIALGLGVSTGHPLGIVLGGRNAGRVSRTRYAQGVLLRLQWAITLPPSGQWLPAWIAIPSIPQRFSSLLRSGVITAILLSSALVDRNGHLIVCTAYGERLSRSWQPSSLRSASSALLLRWSPRATFFPGTGWTGLAAVGLLPGIFLSDASFELSPTLRRSELRYWFLHRHFNRTAVSSRLTVARLLVDGLRSILISAMSPDPSGSSRRRSSSSKKRPSRRRASSSFRKQLSPGGPKQPRRSGGNPLTAAERAAKYSPIGAGLPAKSALPKDEPERLSDLRSYDFGAAIAALQTMDSPRTIPENALSNDLLKSRQEPTDNTMLIVGAESTTFYQRVPVPIGMWRPFNRTSVPLRLNGPGILAIDNQRVAVLICYEQMLTFPILASMLKHPTVIVGISNTFWVDSTTIPRYQASALRGWAKLFRLPYFSAVNS